VVRGGSLILEGPILIIEQFRKRGGERGRRNKGGKNGSCFRMGKVNTFLTPVNELCWRAKSGERETQKGKLSVRRKGTLWPPIKKGNEGKSQSLRNQEDEKEIGNVGGRE